MIVGSRSPGNNQTRTCPITHPQRTKRRQQETITAARVIRSTAAARASITAGQSTIINNKTAAAAWTTATTADRPLKRRAAAAAAFTTTAAVQRDQQQPAYCRRRSRRKTTAAAAVSLRPPPDNKSNNSGSAAVAGPPPLRTQPLPPPVVAGVGKTARRGASSTKANDPENRRRPRTVHDKEATNVNGQGLFDSLQSLLKHLDLDIDNVREQSYDNGSNMKGKHKGVQKKLSDINPRAFYTPCASHSLNLTLSDMANSCEKNVKFFGVVQRIYTFFAYSTKMWKILKDNLSKKSFTLKSMLTTRWESRVESVKVIVTQAPEIVESLHQLANEETDVKIKSEATCLAEYEFGSFEFITGMELIWCSLEPVQELSPQETFRIQYFVYIVDQAISSLERRFEQYKQYEEIFGFLFTAEKLKSMNTEELKASCYNLEKRLQNGHISDIDDASSRRDLFASCLEDPSVGYLDLHQSPSLEKNSTSSSPIDPLTSRGLDAMQNQKLPSLKHVDS
ncbi:hypothetical protein OSB04_019273 [Centaurea solstitialis]|uniref:DUF4371 domain-containing protein n=1 Tax=Centaurea solstitialis TaxID=347529 RepID=A0AA38T290_9ASTR|nr:hypothetical protein OSB04_019273 [Centaurea solstitialis]